MKRISLYCVFLALVLFSACEVEFSPNAEWKDIPVVFCVLDQDDDTTWARIERCYLGDGDIYGYSAISDSFNYPQGSITVSLLAYRNGQQVDSMDFLYKEIEREEGNFANTAQPTYYFPTANRLKDDCTYVLKVRRSSDGTVIASSDPVPLVIKEAAQVISKPTNTGSFGFYDKYGSSAAFCKIEWPALKNARLYQPVVRFYYSIDDVEMYEDFKCNTIKANTASTYHTFYSRATFLEELYQRLKDDPRQKVYLRKFDIYLTACSEELNAYMSTASSGTDIDDSHEVYSNIDNGRGILASRRTHLFKSVPGDSSNLNNTGLYFFLMDLGINMI